MWRADRLKRATLDSIAVTDGKCAGASRVAPLESDLVLWKPYVLPEYQRAEVARRFMDAASERARSKGCDLLAAARTKRAGVFYRRQGTVETQRR